MHSRAEPTCGALEPRRGGPGRAGPAAGPGSELDGLLRRFALLSNPPRLSPSPYVEQSCGLDSIGDRRFLGIESYCTGLPSALANLHPATHGECTRNTYATYAPCTAPTRRRRGDIRAPVHCLANRIWAK